ncbi:MAG: hypothetical protein EXS36_08870 [Pedosphaera sp.]|nr:hypothetical protein [Pedosphaera sp.]
MNEGSSLSIPGGLSGIVAIAAGAHHTVALKNDGTVVAWGNGAQDGIPAGLSEVIAVGAGFSFTVALENDGTVVAWGANDQGQTKVPVGLSEVVAIAVGTYHTVALKSDGLVGPNGATARAQVVNGFVVGVNVIGGGHGYTVPPLVVIKGGGGSNATATAIISGGSVTGFTVTNPGIRYTSQPKVLIASPPFSPELAIEVSRVNVNMRVVLGRKYQLQASRDLKVWTIAGAAFVADSESVTQEFVVAEVGRYFRVVEIL